MNDFYNKIKKKCEENDRVALFVDMDGTIVEYEVYPNNFITIESKGLFINLRPLNLVINILKELNKIENLDIYVLSLCRSKSILEEKKSWLKVNVPFIKEDNYIILCREIGDYNTENREYIKYSKIEEKLSIYNYVIMLDDEHAILKRTKNELKDRGSVFHISSVIN